MKDIIGHGGGGDSHTHYEAKDSLHNTAYARVLDLVSEGEILGLANGLASVYLNQTPVENADGTKNFSNVTVDFRTGTQGQDYIPGFPDVENEVSVGVELRSGTPWVHAISNTSLSAIRVTLGVPMLTKQDTNNGDVLGYKIDYQIELSTDGGAYSTVLSSSFSGKTTSEYRRSARIDLPTATTGWQIRVTRLTANASTASIADTTNIVSYTEVIDAKLRYPMSAIVGIQVDASQFQNVPARAYELYGRIIQVPSNYDAMARTYTGTWDGTFKPSWSNNPAWVFRDLVLNDRYGLGHRISAAQIDKWELYQIARYCDELVPNGKGGTEPRFTCNLYLQSRKQAYAVLQDLASIFRGISYWGAGSIFASADMPADPVYVYTAANVIGGKFTRTGSRKKTRYTVALVTWNDPGDFYKPKVEYVEDPEGIARYGIQQVELTAFGCTSQGQAQRAGRWALATSRLETEGITFDVGMDGAIARPGQIVRVADPSRMGRRVGGRVRTASGRIVTLDKAPTVKAGDRLTVVLPTGASETHTVASVAGDAVTVDADWSTLPAAQSVWSVDSDELSAPLFRVLSVTEKDEVTFTITAVQHEPGKFDFVENGTAITPRTQTALDVTTQAPPASVTLAGYTVTLNDVQKLALQVSCAPVAGAVAYEGAYKRGDGNWVAIPRQPSPTMDVTDVLPGTYLAKMSAVNAIGVTSVETLSVAVDLAKDGASKNAALLLVADAPAFHTNQANQTDPASINFTASLIALDGPVTWSCVGGTLTSKTATTAQLTFANMLAAAATVTASVTAFGRTYSQSVKVTKIQDGAVGSDGLKTAIARLYQWASTAPAKPAGTSTFTWATVSNGSYSGSDGWTVAVPANPGTPGLRLYVASVSLSAAAAAATSSIGYTSATVEAWSQNGANGSPGATGVQSAVAVVYQWAATIPAGPAGAPTWTWASQSFGAAPTGWSLTPGTSPSAGMTLWAARVQVTDSAANASTVFNWSSASITAAGYAGTNGVNGAAAAYVVVSATGQVFSRATSVAAFAPASLTLTATPYGGAATYQWQYWTGSAWANVATAGTSATYAVAPGDFADSRTYRVQATIGGTVYTDQVTLVQVTGGKDGSNAITGFLTNEAVALPASSSGTVADFSAASGTFRVYDGTTDKTGASVTYSVASQTGCTVAINTAGAYSVSAMTTDSATAVLQAVYGGVTLQMTLVLAKAKAGVTPAAAAYVIVSNNGQVFSRATSAGTFAPTSLTLTATPYGGSATYQWQYRNGGVWTNVATGGTSSTYTVASGDFTDARTYRVQATIGGVSYYDEVTLVQVTGGQDGANAISGFLTNESAALAATNAGTVSDFSAAAGTFKVFDGVTDKTGAAVTYSVASQTGCTVAISTAGAYSVSAMSVDSANAVFQAVYGGVTLQKTLTLAKARAGASVTGQAGASYVTAYCASASVSATGAPAPTNGKTSLPAANSGGINGTWSATVPTLTSDQYMYQSDGLYDPATNQVTWSTPYWSSLKVGSLSTVHHNTGDLTVTGTVSDGAGNWSIDSTGAMVAKKFTLIDAATGAVVMTAGGKLNAAYAAAGTLNADLDPKFAGLDTPFLRWDFTNTYDLWSASSSATMSFGATSITWAPTVTNPLLSRGLATAERFVGANYPRVRACVRRTGGTGTWEGNLYYATAGHGSSNSYVKTIPPPPNLDQWNILEWDMSALTAGGTDWMDNTITSLRIDLVSDTGSTWEIDWIAVGVFSSGVSPTIVQQAATDAAAAKAGLAGKLNAGAASTLTGAMTVSTTGGIGIGTLTWNASGGRTGGYGVGITSAGIAAYNSSGLPTFVLDATNGNATFYGTLSGASGSLGSVHLYSGGIHGGAYSSYSWVASGQVGFYLGPEGLKLGCLADNKYFNADQYGNVWAPNFSIVNGVLSLTNPNITNATMDSFTATMSGNAGGSFANGSTGYGTLTANPSGGKAPYSYRWTLVEVMKTGSAGNMVINSTTSQSASFSGSGTNATLDYSVTCIVTDANGRTATLGTEIIANHGTPP